MERRWRIVLLVLNAALVCLALWAAFRTNDTDSHPRGYEKTFGVSVLVLVPALAILALIRPAIRLLGWTAIVVNALAVMLGTALLTEFSVRTLPLYLLVALLVGPGLVVVTLARQVRRASSRSDESVSESL